MSVHYIEFMKGNMQQFEHTKYLIYRRCMDGYGPQNSSKVCLLIEKILVILVFFFVFCLVYLHSAFVGSSGCLPLLLDEYAKVNLNEGYIFSKDDIFDIFLTENPPLYSDSNRIDQINSRHLLANASDLIRNHSNPDYQYSSTWELLELSDKIITQHNFNIVNISMGGKECFGNSLTQALIPFGGVDVVILNNLMYTSGQPGFILTKGGNYYSWNNNDLNLNHFNVISWFIHKVSLLMSTAWAFFFISSITALVVRTLISSGVILFFPLFWTLQVSKHNVIVFKIFLLLCLFFYSHVFTYLHNHDSAVDCQCFLPD